MTKPICPICRTSIENQVFRSSWNLDAHVWRVVRESAVEDYDRRVKAQEEWNNRRRLVDVSVGEEVSVLAMDHRWCAGRVVSIDLTDEASISVSYHVYIYCIYCI
jgi:hypothetical protein